MRKGSLTLVIYLDHAATTPIKDEVLQVMLPYLKSQYANASSSYSAARDARRAIDAARMQVARLIGAHAYEIYVTSGGSESDNWAISGAARAAGKRHIVTSSIEHHAVLRTCEALEKDGFRVTYVPVKRNGVVDMEEIRRLITPETALVSIMLANNEVGTLQPVAEIAALAHRYGALMHTDAVQAVGHIPVDVDKLGVDLLSLSAHKFYGPKGIGALYIRKGTKLDRLIHGGEQEMGMRAGTENTAGIVGMGKAAALAGPSIETHTGKITALRNAMIRMALERLPSVRINGMDAERLPGHVHMTIEGIDSSLLLMQLDMMGIAASAGSACAAGAAERSHVIEAMGIKGENQADIRFTIGEQNTYEDVSMTIEALVRILLH